MSTHGDDRTEDLRADLERLQTRRARSNDAKTQARLDERIRVLTVRIGRKSRG